MWKYFKKSDFACAHCGENKMQDDFITKLDMLREQCGFPLPVNSGYRCPAHNVATASTGPNGPHTTGRAVDLGVNRKQAFIVQREAYAMGVFTGIGSKQHSPSRFLHLDDLEEPAHTPRPTVWTYT